MKIENGNLIRIEEEDIINGVVKIPDNVDNIGDFSVLSLENLTSINVDSKNQNYRSIDGILFNKLGVQLIRFPEGNNSTEYTIPNNVTSIEQEAFSDCKSLEEIVIPDSITSIEQEAFSNCKSLEGVVIPDSVTSIGKGAFMFCYGLEEIVISNSVTSINQATFFRM